MATAADQVLSFDDVDGLVKAITTTDNAVSVFHFPPNVGAVSLIITGNPATLLFSQGSTVVNGLARPAVNTLGRLDLPVGTVASPVSAADAGLKRGAAFKIAVCTTTDGSNCTVQAQMAAL